MDERIMSRVRRGAALLDEQRPGWRDGIDPDRLDISDPQLCVLGQLDGSYSDGRWNLGVAPGHESASYGFVVVPGCLNFDAEFEALTAAWLYVLGEPV